MPKVSFYFRASNGENSSFLIGFLNRIVFYHPGTVGLVPPLVTTPFVTQDQGNSGPRFIRSSMYW